MSNCAYLLHWNVGAGAVDVWMRDGHPSFLPTNDKDDYTTAQANIHIFYANKTLYNSKLVSRKSKLKLYWSIIRPIVTYGCETWALKENIIQKLSVFERRILRKIFGPTKMNDGIWRIKTNMELDNLIQHRNIINYVKSKRMS